MRNSTLRGLMLAMALGFGAACGGSQPEQSPVPTPGPNDETVTVRVENQSGDDMTIYLWRSAQRMRLGSVSVGQTQTFRIPKTIVHGVTTLRFEADPLGRRRNSISEEISVHPGEEIVLRLPPR